MDAAVGAGGGAVIVPWEGSTRTPRKWQAEAYPVVMASLRAGRPTSLVGCTGSGKSVLLTEAAREVALVAGPAWRVVIATSRQDLVKQLHATVSARIGGGLVGRWYGRSKTPNRVTVACYNSLGTLAEHHDLHGLQTALLICDEGHRLTTKAQWAAVHAIAPRARLMMTATPYGSQGFRSDPLCGWDPPVYTYGIGRAIREGVLVPPVPYHWTGDPDADGTTALLSMLESRDPQGPGVVNAYDIEDAETFAERLTAEGYPAAPFHSKVRASDRVKRLKALERGDLRCVVQPLILTEGYDLPWLAWIGLRAPCTYRDLVQLVGRGLRTHPGKRECMVLDPLRQMERPDSLEQAACLMESFEALAEKEAAKEQEAAAAKEREELQRVERLAVSVGEASAWVERLATRVRAAGWVHDTPPAGSWRDRAPTAKQEAALAKVSSGTRWLPSDVREPVRLLLDNPGMLTAGAASDLVTVLGAARRQAVAYASQGGGAPDWKRRWQWDREAVQVEAVTW